MSTDQLIEKALALPLKQRVGLAQTLWRSIERDLPAALNGTEADAVSTARRSDTELASGKVVGRTHQQVMAAARKALRCT
jgi:hypothetical protein